MSLEAQTYSDLIDSAVLTAGSYDVVLNVVTKMKLNYALKLDLAWLFRWALYYTAEIDSSFYHRGNSTNDWFGGGGGTAYWIGVTPPEASRGNEKYSIQDNVLNVWDFQNTRHVLYPPTQPPCWRTVNLVPCSVFRVSRPEVRNDMAPFLHCCYWHLPLRVSTYWAL